MTGNRRSHTMETEIDLLNDFVSTERHDTTANNEDENREREREDEVSVA